MAETFGAPTLYAEHFPEAHRTVNPDRTVTEVELPGYVEVGVELDGARLVLGRFKAGAFLNERAEAQASNPTPTPTPETTPDAPSPPTY